MALTGDRARATYWPGLDGLRGLAVLLVVFCHLDVPGFLMMAGQVGVTMFFTLSGFLITSILCEELERAGRVNLGAFYLRRARRLLPALYVAVAVVALISFVFDVPLSSAPELVGATLYCTNFLSAAGWVPAPNGALHHTWSLVLEEQFYLLWPAVLLLGWRRRAILNGALIISVLAAIGYRVYLWRSGAVGLILFGSLARCDELLVGCLLALTLRGRAPRKQLPGLGVLVLIVCYLLQFMPAASAVAAMYTLASAATVVLILGEIGGGGTRILHWRPLRAVGKVSYGLYLWHHIVLITFRHTFAPQDWITTSLWVLPTSVLLTLISFRYVEQPVLGRAVGRRARRTDELIPIMEASA